MNNNYEEDNIYIYKEEEENPDNSPINYAVDQENEEQAPEADDAKKSSPIKLMFLLMFNPVEGWKKIRREGLKVDQVQSSCFYPLLALLAVSKFADYFYSAKANLSQIVTEGVVAFVSFFFGYFSVIMFLKIVLKKQIGEYFDSNFGKIYIMLSMSTLVLFSIITNVLPMLWPILIFLPLWTIYIMYRGIRFFKLNENSVLKFTILSCGSVIAFPLLIEWLLNLILPY